MDVFGTAVAYRKPFHRFPCLKHHAHPFFVVDDALPKFQQHRLVRPRQHLDLLIRMEQIQVIWTHRQALTKQPKVDDDDDNDTDTLKLVTRSMGQVQEFKHYTNQRS